MTRARRIGAAGLALVLIAAAAGLLLTRGTPRHVVTPRRITSQSIAQFSHGRRVGAMSSGRIGFALNLRLDEQRLNAYLAHVTPGSGSRPSLTASQFGERFGESSQQLGQLRAVLGRLGISVTRLYPQRTAMLVSARVDRLHQIFGLRLGRYRTAGGQPYFAVERAPQIPASLRPYISGLGDLSNAPVPADDIPASGLTPKVTASAYDITPLWARGDNGKGETIAVASAFGAINPSDLQAFATKYGVPEPQVEVKKINGGSAFDPEAGSDDEVDLDLEVIGGVAPGRGSSTTRAATSPPSAIRSQTSTTRSSRTVRQRSSPPATASASQSWRRRTPAASS